MLHIVVELQYISYINIYSIFNIIIIIIVVDILKIIYELRTNSSAPQAWRKILGTLKMCPGLFLERIASQDSSVDPSSSMLHLAHLMNITVNDGELVLLSQSSELAFKLKVSKHVNCT